MSNTFTDVKKSETKSNPQYSPTIRIHADLFEPTESRYPVFNYQKLLLEEKRRRRRDQQSNSFEENDDLVKNIADHFEQKYASNNVKKKKKKKTAFYNYSELAAGYDENDSFIDNTELFDEVMPEEVETEHGGYYVNTGSLEFKKVNVSEDSKEQKSSRQKNVINTVILDDSDEKLPSFAATNNSDKDSPPESKASDTSKGLSSSSEEEKECIKSIDQPTVSTNGKTKRRQSFDSDSNSSIVPIKRKRIITDKPMQEQKVHAPESKPSCSKDTQLSSSPIEPTLENNVSTVIESVITAACTKVHTTNPSSINNDKVLVEIIESLKTEAQIATQMNPPKELFSDQMNLLLLSLEYQKELFPFDANSIYATLAEHMLCDKEKLVKQVIKLVDGEEAKISDLVIRLKNAIDKLMPSVVEQHSIDCQTVIERRNVNGTPVEGMKLKPGPKLPRRKFPWNDEFRNYLREIINVRTTTYSKIKRIESVDVYITAFLNSKIKPLWPAGWMKVNILLKEIKAKDFRIKTTRKQALHNSPTKLLNAIKIASEHKVSHSSMTNKTHKWCKQKSSKVQDSSNESSSVITSHTTTVPVPTTSTHNFKPVPSSSISVPISTPNNDVCPYKATITTTLNGNTQKETESNSVIVKTKPQTGDILDLSPNKASTISFVLNNLKDVSVINNNSPQEKNVSGKPDLQCSPKQSPVSVVNHSMSRKQRLLQEFHNVPLSDQQSSLPNSSPLERHCSKAKNEIVVSSSNKLDSPKVDIKPTAKDILSQMINDSLKDNTTPLQSQLTTPFYKPREESKSPASVPIKVEYQESLLSDRSSTKTPFNNNRASSTELVEKQAQDMIKELLVLNQLSSGSSCSSRTTREEDVFKKHSPSITMYSSAHNFDSVVNTSLGVIHHPSYKNTYNTTVSSFGKATTDLTKDTSSIGIPKMSFGFHDVIHKHMVKTEETNSLSTSDKYQKHGVERYSILPNSPATLDKLSYQQFYSSLNKKPNSDMSHNSFKYSNNNK
ncbi:ubinuclein-2 [Adelges cooleyi]|uniref:ubinuclein-2 n=1 Tax=Adelges cooleyi TaxID=133065 RepID=UPI00217F3F48|nr:ubinuclein-2 [Adelges cooleyi]